MTELRPGTYEHIVTADIRRQLHAVDGDLVHREGLHTVDGEEILVRHVAGIVRRALRIAGGAGESQPALARQVAATNAISAAISDIVAGAALPEEMIDDSQDVLLAVAASKLPDGSVRFPQRPQVGLTSSALLVNGRDQPQIGREIVKELASADRVDLLCAFIKWTGLRLIQDALHAFLRRGGKLRIITTTYIGATDLRAVNRLEEMGADVAVSYDSRRTRLHAKAWLFHRDSGLDTAYVGSSNLSRAAMLDGLEWNVRLARAEQPHLLDTFAATFEEYWNDPSFERYDRERDNERLRNALALERGGSEPLPLQIANIDIHPYPYQSEILEQLAALRTVHDHRRNLVVMATGTGKTIVAALDYARLAAAGNAGSLLFIAHRKEILEQALTTFRMVLKDGSFGELLVGTQKPTRWEHVFASIQSLNNLQNLPADQFTMVIVDEFHHAAANTYAQVLDRLTPHVLLGLTATPERPDGDDILHWFDGARPAVELRLWEALERSLLAPFHYFGIHDDVDLSAATFRRGRYDAAELTTLYLHHRERVDKIVHALNAKVADLATVQAIGFCVSIEHAEFMAEEFNRRNIAARALSSRNSTEERESTLRALKDGTVRVVFTVDLFNEGVDVPDIDTILFLRPTESATVFLQQLGRGLRLTATKDVLTVLDFVGHQHKDFRFDHRFTALTGIPRTRLSDEVEAGFPTLPAGCSIDLDHEVSALVLSNLRRSLTYRFDDAVSELRALGDLPLPEFLERTDRALHELYANKRGGWTRVRRAAGFDQRPTPDAVEDAALAQALGRLLHVDDPERLSFLRELLIKPHPPRLTALTTHEQRLLRMVQAAVDSGKQTSEVEKMLDALWRNHARHEEFRTVIDILYQDIRRVTPHIPEAAHLPLRLHAQYSKDELLAAFGLERTRSWVQGVRWIADAQADVFMVTINKSERGYKPSTMYNDRAITPSLIQWESQNHTRQNSKDGQRYINHRELGSSVHLFIRETKAGAPPYLYAGPMTYQSHEGERPMRILWELAYELPADVFHYAKVATG
ncbi:DUF3427 domain-containing protein [Actinomadura flavalba]|uniref:DUF3427 domain-containing protein n=1 Tax=Actinomadura flavalba TaxID=1120938 RepID=UPI000373E9E1|nr:DEAD/DEAH box helicase [Actinomadura flavalba]